MSDFKKVSVLEETEITTTDSTIVSAPTDLRTQKPETVFGPTSFNAGGCPSCSELQNRLEAAEKRIAELEVAVKTKNIIIRQLNRRLDDMGGQC